MIDPASWASDRRGAANLLSALGEVYANAGESKRALEYHQKALAVYQELVASSVKPSMEWSTNRYHEGLCLENLGHTFAGLGDLDRARELGSEALHIFESCEQTIAWTHPPMGSAAQRVRRWFDGLGD
jgi:tetratricopeptide (TPR) repeat protein